MQDKVIERLLRWNVLVIVTVATIHYLSGGIHFDLIEIPIMIFFFTSKLLSIPQIWVTLLVVCTARYLKN